MSGDGALSPTRRWLLLVVITALVLAAAGGVVGWRLHRSKPATVSAPPSVALRAPNSGVYVGPGEAAEAAAFGLQRKVPVRFAIDFLPTGRWQDISSSLWLFRDWQDSGLPLMLAVPMLPDAGKVSLADGARGEYNHYFRTLAENLVRFGEQSASLRIGWEMNGGWYRWSAASDPVSWIGYYRQIVTTMRSVPGARFTFVWNPNTGTRSMDAEAAYPGDAYVDQIGMDIYDWEWNTPDATPQSRWVWMRTHLNGLDWLAAFAAAHHKPISLPEWGLAQPQDNTNGGGGDDPYYVSHLLDWAAAHHVVAEAYFNSGTHQLANFPAAEQAYMRAERSIARLPRTPQAKRLTAMAEKSAAGVGAGSSGTRHGSRTGSK